MKRTDRIGKHLVQRRNDCLLVAWCMAGGYRYSDSREQRYAVWLKANKRVMANTNPTATEAVDRAFGRYIDDYIVAYKEAKQRQVPRRQMERPAFKGNGTLNMWSNGGICHAVAVIDTPQGHIILDPSDRVKRIYTSYTEYIRSVRSRPTLVTFVEVT